MTTPTKIGGGADAAVLEDLSGRRARWLRRGGRVVFVAFLAWLVAIVLGGLGLAPVPGIPFTEVLRTAGPPPLDRPVRPTQPSAADLRPALPDAALAQTTTPAAHSEAQPNSVPVPSGRASAPSQTSTVPPGRSGSAPGQTETAPPGRSGEAPGQTSTPPGQTRTTPRRKP
jgi:hypothetical protein